MVRRTKNEALATRQTLLDAAERLFQAQGVSRTSLHEIARAAGTTRGAIYWHFKDKADLFNAMMERVTLPLENAFEHLGKDSEGDTLDRLRAALQAALHQIATDERTRRVFEVLTQKVEYIDELQAVRARHLASRNGFLEKFKHGLRLAAERQQLLPSISLGDAAQGMHALIDGLIQNWLLDTQGFDLEATSRYVIDSYLKGLGFKIRELEEKAISPAGPALPKV